MTERPIFILGIQRGGTNQILNILRSHPDTYWPQGEFHEVFRAKGRGLRKDGLGGTIARWRRYAPVRRGAGDILDPDTKPPQTGLLKGARGEAVRAGLAGSARSNRAAVMDYKHKLLRNGLLEELPDPGRMLCKVMNYNLLFAEDLLELYPGATFVGVIRDGRGVCEGHIARGGSVQAATEVYEFVGNRLIEMEQAGLPLRTWRFEDLLADTEAVAGEIYDFCGLGTALVNGVCLQDKERVLNDAGDVIGVHKVDKFYSFADMGAHMRKDVNAGALSRLAPEAQEEISVKCGPVLRHFGYV